MLTLWRLLIASQEAIIRGALQEGDAQIRPAEPPQDEPTNEDRERRRLQDPDMSPPSGHDRPPEDPPPMPPATQPPQRSAPTQPESPRSPQRQEQAPPPARPSPEQRPPDRDIATALTELARRILDDRNSASPLGSDTDDPDEMRRRRDAFESARRTIDWERAEFRSDGLLKSHFADHGRESNHRFNVRNEREYLARARALLSQPIGNGIEGALRANGDVLIYNRNTGEFAVAAADGTRWNDQNLLHSQRSPS